MREIETIGIVARRGIAALLRGDMKSVGRAMSENHLLLRSLGVSCPELEALISAAAPSSLGVKLTGAGGELTGRRRQELVCTRPYAQHGSGRRGQWLYII